MGSDLDLGNNLKRLLVSLLTLVNVQTSPLDSDPSALTGHLVAQKIRLAATGYNLSRSVYISQELEELGG